MKVYFDGRHINIVSATEPSRGYTRVVTVADGDQLRHEVETFAADASLPDTLVRAQDVDSAIHQMRSIYRIILAAGGVIFNSRGEYLVIDRRGVADLPKGKAEAGETATQTALREVAEETGLKGANIIDKLGLTFHTYMIGEERVLKQTTWFTMSVPGQPLLTPETAEGITAARWVSKAQMAAEAEKTYNSLKDIFLAAAR